MRRVQLGESALADAVLLFFIKNEPGGAPPVPTVEQSGILMPRDSWPWIEESAQSDPLS